MHSFGFNNDKMMANFNSLIGCISIRLNGIA